MRILAFHPNYVELKGVQDLYTALKLRGVDVMVVTDKAPDRGSSGILKSKTGIRKSESVDFWLREHPADLLLASGPWSVPVTQFALDNNKVVGVICTEMADLLELSEFGYLSHVDVFIVAHSGLLAALNRNVNYVVAPELTDNTDEVNAVAVATVLRNVTQHHRGTKPRSKDVRCAREADRARIAALCEQIHGEKPSYAELQYFLDAFYDDRQREVLIPRLGELLERGWNLREVRGLLDTAPGEWF